LSDIQISSCLILCSWFWCFFGWISGWIGRWPHMTTSSTVDIVRNSAHRYATSQGKCRKVRKCITATRTLCRSLHFWFGCFHNKPPYSTWADKVHCTPYAIDNAISGRLHIHTVQNKADYSFSIFLLQGELSWSGTLQQSG